MGCVQENERDLHGIQAKITEACLNVLHGCKYMYLEIVARPNSVIGQLIQPTNRRVACPALPGTALHTPPFLLFPSNFHQIPEINRLFCTHNSYRL
ncbi:hypothetical protein Y032_0098g3140 [Ancylostoma ceylanicum]|uniref:Uncharacterized protein n=1 Tax=Ancylostoma ceylanicum TaxID=53326 RepID=A0A016TJQ5_9BILA|nr:hypothetical protein Y032_0098g3140 [Ancylostoma ceylanicum]